MLNKNELRTEKSNLYTRINNVKLIDIFLEENNLNVSQQNIKHNRQKLYLCLSIVLHPCVLYFCKCKSVDYLR